MGTALAVLPMQISKLHLFSKHAKNQAGETENEDANPRIFEEKAKPKCKRQLFEVKGPEAKLAALNSKRQKLSKFIISMNRTDSICLYKRLCGPNFGFFKKPEFLKNVHQIFF